MTAPIKPALKRAFGNDTWAWVPAVASKTAPTVAELTAATGFNLSCSLFGEQEGFTATTEKVTLPRRLCETETFEVNGSTNYAAPDFMVSFDPQAAAGADGKKAWEAMDDLSSGFLIRRQGVTATTDFTAGEFVDVIPAQLGVKVPTKTGTGSDGVYAFTVGASITDTPAWNVAVAA
jgi:hypothetical protein